MEVWELLPDSVTDGDRVDGEGQRYSQTDPDETEVLVLDSMHPECAVRVRAVMSVRLSHVREVCRLRGLPVTGTKLMLSACLVACNSRRSEHPDVLVDSAIDGDRVPQPMEGFLHGPAIRGAGCARRDSIRSAWTSLFFV